MPIDEPDSCSCCLLVFLLGAILQGALAFSQEFTEAPSVVRNASFSAAERSDAASDPPKSPEPGSLDSSDSRFLRRWAKRGALGRVAHLRNRDGCVSHPIHQLAALPLRCCGGKHRRLFDRTAYFPGAL